MLRFSLNLLGRYKRSDFLQGRPKSAAGFVHTRSIMGRRGRATPFSRHHGFRDGLPHQGNTLKGELGVRLGGGLYGSRTPLRELANLSPTELDVIVHGHPSITNPYRGMLEEHPRLEDVVRGSVGGACLVFPVGRSMTSLAASSETENDSSSNHNNISHEERNFRFEEREFVVKEAARFLSSSSSSSSMYCATSALWRTEHRSIVIGTMFSSCVISAPQINQLFEQQQHQGAPENAAFDTFLRSFLLDSYRSCFAAARGAQSGDEHSIFNVLSAQTGQCLRVVLAPPPPPHSRRSSAAAGAAALAASNRKRSSVDSLVKWYLRANDPRSHFNSSSSSSATSGAGHSRSRFRVVAVCPFSPLQPWAQRSFDNRGFFDVAITPPHRDTASNKTNENINTNSSAASQFLDAVASIVLDDTAKRVPLASAGDVGATADAAAPARGEGLLPLGPEFTGRDLGRRPRQQLLFPHLTRPMNMKIPRLSSHNQDQQFGDDMAKSYFHSS